MTSRVSLAAAAAILFAGFTAHAQGVTDPTTGAAPVDTTNPGGNNFGSKGQIVISDVEGGIVPSLSLSGNGGTGSLGPAGSIGYVSEGGSGVFVLVLQPALDYFAIDHISIGGAVAIGFFSGSGQSVTELGLLPRVGYVVNATPKVSVWPRLALDLSVVSGGGTTDTEFGVVIDAPILYHVTDHFFIGGSPTLSVGLTGDEKVTAFTANLIIGGWM